MNTNEQFYADCGQIILISTSIEHELGKYLTAFLLIGKKEKMEEYPENQFADMKFDHKINLIEKFCETRKTDIKNKEELINSLHIIQRARNKVAHWGLAYNKQEEKFELKHITNPNKEPFDAIKAREEACQKWSVALIALMNLHNEIFFPKDAEKQ